MKAFKARIHPTTEQAILIDKTIGCCRFVYNGLNAKITQYEKDKTNISTYDLIKQLPQQKKEFEWLKEVDSIALQQSLIDLQSAYTKFLENIKGSLTTIRKVLKIVIAHLIRNAILGALLKYRKLVRLRPPKKGIYKVNK